MNNLLLRRRELLGKAAEKDDYISDGLAFHLDCADATLTKWVDKVGGIEFDMTDITIADDGGVCFNGSSSSGAFSENLNFPYNTCTIEVVVFPKSAAAGMVFFTNAADMVAFGLGTYVIVKSGTSNPRTQYTWDNQNFTKFTFSAAGTDTALRNKEYPNASGKDTWYLKNKGTYIGSRSGIQYFFKGNIYQIRIYNRVLTEEEILHNQTIDMMKYNIQ